MKALDNPAACETLITVPHIGIPALNRSALLQWKAKSTLSFYFDWIIFLCTMLLLFDLF